MLIKIPQLDCPYPSGYGSVFTASRFQQAHLTFHYRRLEDCGHPTLTQRFDFEAFSTASSTI